MTKKRFVLKEDFDWWGITDNQLPKTKFGFREDLPAYLECDYRYNDLTHQEVVDLLNELNNENEQLKQALFFFLAIALTDSSIDYQNDADKWCNILLNCDYEEAKRRYGDFKYEKKWDLE